MPAPISITYISEAVCAEVKAAWDAEPYAPSNKGRGLPSPNELSPTVGEWGTLLNTAFATSLRTDESRQTRVRLAFQRSVEPPCWGVLGFPTNLNFDEPIPMTVGEVVRLAHATAFSGACIWLVTKKGEEAFLVRGLGPASRARRSSLTPALIAEAPAAAIPIVEAIGQGRLRILKGDIPVALLEGEALIFPRTGPLTTGVVGEKLAAFVEDRVNNARNDNSKVIPVTEEATFREYLAWRAAVAMAHIVEGVVHCGHGGLIVVLPHTLLENGRLPSSFPLRVKYQCSAYFASPRNVASSIIHYEAPRYFEFMKNTGSELGEMGKTEMRKLQDLTYSDELARYATTIARVADLSGVDGAIVLSDRLDCLGFGAEVLCEKGSDEWCHEVTTDINDRTAVGSQTTFLKYGTRHRAAFRICKQSPSVFAWVVSQDGDTKLVYNREGKVCTGIMSSETFPGSFKLGMRLHTPAR